ncbi:hypothetical protein MIMGU_mgv1a019922mg [Erythranthe guttata]|uniref:RNA helicase n=1 Tax=Erythranthe guttata TaxID=4155 RepID=A0A022QP04_ERYGU|nr:hypothetical protein MIMGU_mgv1a019922mg [Erythranthe guttata]
MVTPKVSNNLSEQREVEDLCQKLRRASREIVAKVVKGKEEGKSSSPGPLRVLPLHAMLSAKLQLRVFEEGRIKYVVDTGKEKVKKYNSSNSMETYDIQWISKASAAQRAGRAGRTGPGHCYRLYSSAAFGNSFPDFTQAEISKVPVYGVVLLMKSMDIGKAIISCTFTIYYYLYLQSALIDAERCLKVLEALSEKGRLTPLGKAMARYPMSPRETLLECKSSLAHAVAAAAALSLSNPFQMRIEDGTREDSNEKVVDIEEKPRKMNFSNSTSDALTIASALQCFEVSENPEIFCNDNSLHQKTMKEMSKLRKQLLQLVFKSNISDSENEFSWNHGTAEHLNEEEKVKIKEILRKAIFAGWADRVAKRMKGASILSQGEEKVKVKRIRYQKACMVKKTCLVYNELLQGKRPYITSVKANWLPQYARSLCTFYAPLLGLKPYYDPVSDQVFSWSTPTFGPHLWELPPHNLPIEDRFTRVTAEIILQPELPGVKRVGSLLNKLNTEGRVTDGFAKLRELWSENREALFSEIEDWFQDGFRSVRFKELWAEMIPDSEERFR